MRKPVIYGETHSLEDSSSMQKVFGVVRWLQDEGNFIYVLNGDGLWVVSEPADRQPEAESSFPYGD